MSTRNMPIMVALLRGINVGGKNKVSMAELSGLFAEAGCQRVQTFIQSGNVVFRAPTALSAELPQKISEQISKKFGLRVPLVLRSRQQMQSAVKSNPFLAEGAKEDLLHVVFLDRKPGPPELRTLEADRFAPDRFVVQGQEIYLYLPNGAGRTKLNSQYFDSRLHAMGTQRNWRTTGRLLELMQDDYRAGSQAE